LANLYAVDFETLSVSANSVMVRSFIAQFSNLKKFGRTCKVANFSRSISVTYDPLRQLDRSVCARSTPRGKLSNLPEHSVSLLLGLCEPDHCIDGSAGFRHGYASAIVL
jgi:hypothetical protein